MNVPSTQSSAQSTSMAQFRSWLAKRSDDQLATLFRLRPDVVLPLPPGIAPLTTRLLLRTSISRALATCTAAELYALEVAAHKGAELHPVPVTELGGLEAIDTLRAKALLFGDDDIQLPPQVMPALPTGFSLVRQVAITPEDIADLDERQRSILETLAASGGVGTTRDALPSTPPDRPIPQLLAKGLLERVDSQTVRMPRAVRAALAGHTAPLIPTAPSGRCGPAKPDAKADQAGVAAGVEVIRAMDRLIEYLAATPVELLKDKSVGVRQLAQIAKVIDTPPELTARLICLGATARLLGRGEPATLEGNFLAPTQATEQWADLPLGRRWELLLGAWKASTWAPWESSRALDAASVKDHLPRHRHKVVNIFRHTTAALSHDEFWHELRFRFPLFATHTHPDTIDALVAEAEWIGAIAQGRATTVLARDFSHATRLTPDSVNTLIIQSDLTALAPGPLTPELERFIREVADVESPGLASTYRFSEASIRRSFDIGYSAQELQAKLADASPTPLPQTLTYLIADIARRHGGLRAGAALSYIRSDDPTLIQQATHAVSSLRTLAPTVAVSTQPLATVLAQLREAGLSPAAEDETGAFIDATPAPKLLPTPAPKQRTPELDSQRIAAAVRAIRAHDPANNPADTPTPTHDPAELDILHAAARGQRPVTITYATKDGTPTSLTLTPLSVNGGQLDARSTNATIRVPLHRISSVELA